MQNLLQAVEWSNQKFVGPGPMGWLCSCQLIGYSFSAETWYSRLSSWPLVYQKMDSHTRKTSLMRENKMTGPDIQDWCVSGMASFSDKDKRRFCLQVGFMWIQSNLLLVTTPNAKTEWLLIRIEPQGASTKKRSGHIYFMEDNLLHYHV